MKLFFYTKEYLGWTVSIIKKIFITSSVSFMLTAGANLFSHVLRLVSFLLPIKVVLLFGSDIVPSYFPDFLISYGRDQLIIWLSVLAAVSYVLYQYMEKLILKYTRHGASIVLDRSDKITFLLNQENVVIDTYMRFARSVANLIFLMISSYVVFLIDFILFLVFIALFFVSYIGSAVFIEVSDKSVQWLKSNIRSYTSILSAISFFLIFGVIIVEFLIGSELNALFAFIVLFVTRQVFHKSEQFVQDAVYLSRRRSHISAFFLHGYALRPMHHTTYRRIWIVVSQDDFRVNLLNLANSALKSEYNNVSIRKWLDTGLTDIAVIECLFTGVKTETKKVLVKIFDPSKKAIADKESYILSCFSNKQLPSLKLIGLGEIEGCLCHLFEATCLRQLEENGTEPSSQKILETLSDLEVDDGFQNKYLRSHGVLHQRISLEMTNVLLNVAKNQSELIAVKSFRENLDDLCELVSRMPLKINMHGITLPLMILESERAVLYHWGGWCLEPLGASWKANEEGEANAERWVASAVRMDLNQKKITKEQILLVSLLYRFEKNYLRQRYSACIDLIIRLIEFMPLVDMTTKKDR